MQKLFKLNKIFLSVLCLFLLTAVQSDALTPEEKAAPLIKKARDHLNLFQYEKARVLLEKAIKIDSDNWESYYLAGKSYLKQKKEIYAEKYLRKAHELEPDTVDVQKALAAVYIYLAKQAQKQGKNSEMLGFLHKACRAYPVVTKIWVTLFNKWYSAGQTKKIMDEGEFMVGANKRLLEQGDDKYLQQALVIVARCYYNKRDFPEAEKYLDYANRIRRSNEELYSLRRSIRQQAEDEARKLIENAKQLADSGNYNEALEILEQAQKTTDTSEIKEIADKIHKESEIKKFLKEADTLRKEEKYYEALEKLEDASIKYPADERIANLMAVVTSKINEIEKAKAQKNAKIIAEKKRRLEKSQKLRFFVNEAKNYEEDKKYDVAIISLEKALKLSPKNELLKKQIEELKEKSRKQKERQNAFATARSKFEDLFNSKKFEEAYHKGKQLLENYPEYELEITPVLAEAALQIENFDQAKELAITFEDSQENELIYNYIRGMVAYNHGDKDLALGFLKKVDKIDPSFREEISSTIWQIYLYKYQAGIYIILLILAFPIVRFAKSSWQNFKKNSILRKVERIREKGNYAENLSFLEERYAKEDCPNMKQISVMLADALLRKGEAKRAYDIVNKVIKRDSKNPHAKRIAGEACLQLQDTSPIGLEHLQNLYKLDENRKDVVEFLAKSYMKNKSDHKLAQDFILKFISLNPNNSEAITYLADTYIRRQLYSHQSLKIFERSIKIAPDIPDYYAALIANHRKLENHDEARKFTEIAQSRFPNDPQFQDNPEPTSPASGSSGGFPNYDNIGQPAAGNQGAFPDYENIGSPAGNPGGFPDYENIGNEPNPPSPPAAPPRPNDPVKVCPHCQAQNSVKEYYCLSCGKPL
ncbi:MAG: tetratricopeptide repeat protein [Candidatus Rifleibacteriota bacterium]